MKPQDRIRAILNSRVEPPMKLVLVAIADHMVDDRLTAWPKVETIAEQSGYCERQTRGILDDLEKRGLIVRWSGEHKSRDIRIAWEALAAATATPSARGGRRTPAKTATQPANTAGADSGKDCHQDWQSLPPKPAKTATSTGKDCPRSDYEADLEATMEADTHPAHAGPPRAEPGSHTVGDDRQEQEHGRGHPGRTDGTTSEAQTTTQPEGSHPR